MRLATLTSLHLSPGAKVAHRVWPPCWDIICAVGSSMKMVKFEPGTPNDHNTSHQVAERAQQDAYVAKCCVEMLRSFGRVLMFAMMFSSTL